MSVQPIYRFLLPVDVDYPDHGTVTIGASEVDRSLYRSIRRSRS